MDIPNIRPARLRLNDVVGIVAPAGPIEDMDALSGGIRTLERMGFRVRYDDRIFASARYLAGSDEDRAEELMRCFEDPEIRAVVPLRGGFGCSRLIPHLEEKRLRPHCKLMMGFSDCTTLHLFLRRRFGWTTIHGPMATTLGRAAPEAANHLLELCTDPSYRPGFAFPQLEAWIPGVAEGRLVGGCLSLVTASIGTCYEIKTEGKILFLEDQGEPPYRIDRMLTHLRLSGKLDGIVGLLLGSFHDCAPAKGDYTVWDVLGDTLESLHVPILAHFPGGHGTENWAFPLGLPIRLDAGAKNIQFLESAVTHSL